MFLTLLALLYVVVRPRPAPPRTHLARSDEAASENAPVLRAPPVASVEADSESSFPVGGEAARRNPDPNLPVIKRAAFEKSSVCRGEQNFLDVDAHTDNGTDAFLRVSFVDPTSGRSVRGGSRIPVRFDQPLKADLQVMIEGNGATTVALAAPFTLRDCAAPRQIDLRHTRSASALDRIHFQALLPEASAEPGAPATQSEASAYEWDFGDGVKQTTRSSSVDHSYEGREQNVAESSFVVTVTAKTTQGDVQGSLGLSFPNLGFGPLVFEQKVLLAVGYAPAPAGARTPDKVWLYHGYSKAVRIQHAVLTEVKLEPRHPQQETLHREYPVETVLESTVIEARQSINARDLSGLRPMAGFLRHIELSGVTDDGLTVVGAIGLFPEPVSTSTGESQ